VIEARAFTSLDKNIPESDSQIIKGLQSFIQTIVSGFLVSTTAIEYAHTSFLEIFCRVVFRSFSNKSSISFTITSVSVSL
jgi:hypothetical protein